MNRLKSLTRCKPRVGPGKRVFAIGDVHGRHDLLTALLERILLHVKATPPADDILVFLGDYVDRGPSSRAVVEELCNLRCESMCRTVFLRGNHEQAVLEFLCDPTSYRAWRDYGAAETLLSYGVMPPRFEDARDFTRARDEFALRFPRRHFEFLKGLEYSHVEDDYFFVHAGVRPGIALSEQAPEDMMWIRERFLVHRGRFEKMVVHGHTAAPTPVILANRICVDTGAHATGRLTALVLEKESRGFIVARSETMRREAFRGFEAVNS